MSTNNAADYSPIQYNVQVGGALGTLVNVSPSAMAGIPLVSNGPVGNPSFTTAVVAGGGTGAVTLTGVLLGNGTSPVTGITPGNYGVLISDGTGVPSWLANGTTGQILTATTGGTPSWAAPAASSISITGNSGGALTGNSFIFTGGTTGLTFAGTSGPNTETLSGTLAIANGGTNATSMAVIDGTVYYDGTRLVTTATGTSGWVLTSGGAGVAPAYAAPAASSITITGNTGGGLTGNSFTFTGGTTGLMFAGSGSTETLGGTLIVANGGTGIATTTAYAPICGGTTATGNFQAASTGLATSGFVLTSTGNASLPTFQAPAASSISITGDTGGALSGASFTFTGGTTGLSFGGSGSTETLTFAGITANGGTVSLATDATTSTVNIGTGAGAKTVTLGSTNGASVTAIKYGTADFTLASATGTVMNALDTGEITYPLQTAFLAYPNNQSNVTGDGTAYTVLWANEIFDQNGDFASNTFTAPVTGRYRLETSVLLGGFSNLFTVEYIQITTSNRNYRSSEINPGVAQELGSNRFSNCVSVLADMDAADTATIVVFVSGSTKTISVVSGGSTDPRCWFSGNLVC